MSTKLYVGNLPETVRKADLQQMFEGFGKVLECDIVLNYAFVVSILRGRYINKNINFIFSLLRLIRRSQNTVEFVRIIREAKFSLRLFPATFQVLRSVHTE